MRTSRCYTISRGRRSTTWTRENRKLLAKAKIKHPFPFLRSTDDIPAAGAAAFFCSMRAHITVYLPVSPKIDRRAPRGRARAGRGVEERVVFFLRLLLFQGWVAPHVRPRRGRYRVLHTPPAAVRW